jgi:hypothetical protein
MSLFDTIGSLSKLISSAFSGTRGSQPSEYGLRINNRDGSVAYTSDAVTWNQVDTFICPGYSGVSNNYPVLLNKEVLVVQSLINAPPVDRRAIAHKIAVQGTNVSVSGGSESALIVVLVR